jgi:hypothetical protein
MTALLVACAVCDAADGGVQLDVVSSTRRRGGSELDARMVCPTCATVHTITVFLHVGAEAARRTAAAGSIQGEPGVQFGGRS